MPTNHYTGKNMFISFGGQIVSGEWLSFEFNRALAVIDVTAAGESDFVGVSGVQSGHWKLTIFDKAQSGTMVAQALALGESAELIFGPQGNATGQPKFGFNALVTQVHQRFAYDDTVILEFGGIKSGAMTYDFGDVFA